MQICAMILLPSLPMVIHGHYNRHRNLFLYDTYIILPRKITVLTGIISAQSDLIVPWRILDGLDVSVIEQANLGDSDPPISNAVVAVRGLNQETVQKLVIFGRRETKHLCFGTKDGRSRGRTVQIDVGVVSVSDGLSVFDQTPTESFLRECAAAAVVQTFFWCRICSSLLCIILTIALFPSSRR